MMIRLKCINNVCNYSFEVTPKELEDNPQYYKICLLCGSKLTVDNFEEVITFDLYKRAEENINKWIKEIGWDSTIDLIKRNNKQSCYRIYREILQKKGITIKED